MRQLTKSQKKRLDAWQDVKMEIRGWEDLTSEQQGILEAINDTEILWCEVNRYLSDNYFKNRHGRPSIFDTRIVS